MAVGAQLGAVECIILNKRDHLSVISFCANWKLQTATRGVVCLTAKADFMHQILDRHITIDRTICHGRPHIAGHRIRVQDIAVWHERLGLSVDEISTDFNLSMAEIYAALSYYFDHKAEIDMAIDADQSIVPSHQREYQLPLQTRLGELRDQ